MMNLINGVTMDNFKFFTNKIIDKELHRIVEGNYFSILFFSEQLHNKSFTKRNLFKVHDLTNVLRVFKLMLVSYDTNKTNGSDVFELIVFDGINYIRLKIEKSKDIYYEFDTLRCERINMNILDFYCRIRRESF